MHKMTNQIQCGDLAMALEEGLAAIDIDLGSASDLAVTYRTGAPTLSDLKKAFSAGDESFQHALSARGLHERFSFSDDEELLESASQNAFSSGYTSPERWEKGVRPSPPLLLKEIPYLLKAWNDGWAEAELDRTEIDAQREEQEWRSRRDTLIDSNAGIRPPPETPDWEPALTQ
ncbi:hypothetical protein [Pseudomonas sp. GXZC]|uniref:hypothetical protein n=1 Tax=Pseudomonas sp. GXZC TaxID=3003351 RepID=UPI0022AA3CD9|nr:hypothetical protein [Pseudomonas sp. GXZC]WAT32166.1 hypothetical protein OZ428_34465 [Pseudomonas sp. GXZC]WAT32202.1 hypothetical protein OZ428_33525 [Pseudomonas sp. GXZC]